MQNSSHNDQPVSQRIDALDILRGFSLFGVFFLNMLLFSGIEPFEPMQWEGADRVVLWLAVVLVEGKFYPIFAFLFGVGFAIQMQQATAQHDSTRHRRYSRRLLALLLIGIFHMVLISPYDILVEYALLGSLLVPLRTSKPRILLSLALGCLGLSVVVGMLESIHILPYAICEEGNSMAVLAMYQHGLFGDVVALRLHHGLCDLIELTPNPSTYHILGMFLAGAWATRIDVFHRVGSLIQRFRVIMVVGMVFGVAGMLSYKVKNSIGDIAQACSYISIVLLLLRCSLWEQRLKPMAAMGRMSLTNYILNSFLSSILFYGYGLGLMGHVGPAEVLGLAVDCYLLQMMASTIWLHYFPQGPMEAILRNIVVFGEKRSMQRKKAMNT